MKKTVSILSLLLILLVSCSKDDNDSCTPINCLNGGTQTTDCGCDCEEGYTGSNCDTKLIPRSVKITNITVKKFPDTNNGIWWDTFPNNTDADIYITIENPSNIEIYNHPVYYEDASGLNVSYSYTLTPSLIINDVTGLHWLSLLDFDTDQDDFITLLLFRPYDSSRDGFPTSVTIANAANTFECDFTLEYSF